MHTCFGVGTAAESRPSPTGPPTATRKASLPVHALGRVAFPPCTLGFMAPLAAQNLQPVEHFVGQSEHPDQHLPVELGPGIVAVGLIGRQQRLVPEFRPESLCAVPGDHDVEWSTRRPVRVESVGQRWRRDFAPPRCREGTGRRPLRRARPQGLTTVPDTIHQRIKCSGFNGPPTPIAGSARHAARYDSWSARRRALR